MFDEGSKKYKVTKHDFVAFSMHVAKRGSVDQVLSPQGLLRRRDPAVKRCVQKTCGIPRHSYRTLYMHYFKMRTVWVQIRLAGVTFWQKTY